MTVVMKYRFLICSVLFLFLFILLSCRKEEIPSLSLGIQEDYVGTRLQPLYINCGLDDGVYEWRLLSYQKDTIVENQEKVVSTQQQFVAILDKTGDYNYEFVYEKNGERLTHRFSVHVDPELVNYSPYISDVIDYVPAPGRFVNDYLGLVSPPKSYDDVLARCKTIICGGEINKSLSLGAFGGYVIFSFDHTIINEPNAPDFKVYSRIETLSPPESSNPEERIYTKSSNPGVVWVAFDFNNNGKADESEWYELCHPSEGQLVTDVKRNQNYAIRYSMNNTSRYSRTDSSKAREFAIPDHILWESSYVGTLPIKERSAGYIPKLSFDGFDPTANEGKGAITTQREYWPLWRKKDESITLSGTLFPDNGEEIWSGDGVSLRETTRYWALSNTMAHNQPNMAFDIDDAIDKDGNRVHLPGIQFVKVQTGVNLQLGHFGASCTEIQGAVDLHMESLE